MAGVKFWEWRSSVEYFKEQRAYFEQQARRAVMNTLLRREMERSGYDPSRAKLPSSMFDRNVDIGALQTWGTEPQLTPDLAAEGAQGMIRRQEQELGGRGGPNVADVLGSFLGGGAKKAWEGIETGTYAVTGFTREDVADVTKDPLFRFATSGKVALGLEESGDPGQILMPRGVRERFNRLPNILKDVIDVGAAPTTIATAGVGGTLGAMLRGTRYMSRLAPLVEPILQGGFASRLAGETAAGVGAITASRETMERLPEETPGALRFGIGTAAGLLGGMGAVAGLRASQKAGTSLLRYRPDPIWDSIESIDPASFKRNLSTKQVEELTQPGNTRALNRLREDGYPNHVVRYWELRMQGYTEGDAHRYVIGELAAARPEWRMSGMGPGASNRMEIPLRREGPGATALGANGGAPYIVGRYAVGDIGTEGADEIIRSKRASFKEPGEWAKNKIIRSGVAIFNPGVAEDADVLIAYKSAQATKAVLKTEFYAATDPFVRKIEKLLKEAPPDYIGPSGRDAIKGTFKDIGEFPEHYKLSNDWKQALRGLDEADLSVVRTAREQFGGDIAPFDPGKPDAIYIPNVKSRQMLEDAGVGIAEGYRRQSLSSRTGFAKQRYYQTGWDRMQADLDFIPETDIRVLTSAHNEGLANAAANQTFKRAAGGKTTAEVMDELRPGLRMDKERMARDVDNAKLRLDTAENRLRQIEGMEGKWQTGIRAARAKAQPMLDQVDELLAAEEYGPELSYLSGQIRELDARQRTLTRLLGGAQTKGLAQEMKISETRQLINNLTPKLDNLRAAYKNADKGNYVRNQYTNLYHTTAQSASIDKLLANTLGPGDTLAGALDQLRGFQLGGDVSPFGIQGHLAIFADPLTAARHADDIVRQTVSGQEIARIIDEEPDMVRRYVTATGRQFGKTTTEFRLDKPLLERVPLVGKPIQSAADRSYSVVEVMQYNMWKNDVGLVERLNPGIDRAIADDAAANIGSKVIPSLNITERGVSAARGKVERLFVSSTSFLAAPPLLMKDAAIGLAKLSRMPMVGPGVAWRSLDPREQLALLRTINLGAGLFGVSIASSVASKEQRGWSFTEAVEKAVDPNSSTFMSLVIGDKSIPLGGPFRSFLRGLAPRRVGDVEYMPFGGVVQFGRAKLHPTAGAAVDIIKNKDFLGEKVVKGDFPTNVLTALAYGVERVLPITVGAVIGGFREGQSVPEVAETAASQFFGGDIRSRSEYDLYQQRADETSQKQYQKNYDDLEPFEKAEIDKQVQQPVGTRDIDKQFTALDDISSEIRARQEALDANVPLGSQWSAERRTIKSEQAGRFYQWEKDNPEAAKILTGGKPKDANEAARQAYYATFDEARTPWGNVDFDELELLQAELDATLTPEQRAYLERNVGYNKTVKEKEWSAAQKQLEPYYDLEDKIWAQIRKGIPEAAGAETFDDYKAQVETDIQNRGLDYDQAAVLFNRNPIINRVEQAISEQKLRWRLQNPAADAILTKLYGMTPARYQVPARTGGSSLTGGGEQSASTGGGRRKGRKGRSRSSRGERYTA